MEDEAEELAVLNLVITGIPSILEKDIKTCNNTFKVLNLIITGIPSIQEEIRSHIMSFIIRF